MRDQSEDLLRDWAEELRRNLGTVHSGRLNAGCVRSQRIAGGVALELSAPRPVGIPRKRVVNGAAARGEIAVAKGIGWDRYLVELPSYVADVQDIGKEKSPVLDDVATKTATIIIVSGSRHRARRPVEVAARR